MTHDEYHIYIGNSSQPCFVGRTRHFRLAIRLARQNTAKEWRIDRVRIFPTYYITRIAQSGNYNAKT